MYGARTNTLISYSCKCTAQLICNFIWLMQKAGTHPVAHIIFQRKFNRPLAQVKTFLGHGSAALSQFANFMMQL